MTSNTLKIHPIGLDESDLSMVKFFIDKFYKDRCEIVPKYLAEVFMINMDSVGAKKQLEQIKTNSVGSPIIQMAPYTLETSPHFFIRKPLLAEHFEVLLAKIESLPNRQVPQQAAELVILKKHDSRLNVTLAKAKSITSMNKLDEIAVKVAQGHQQNRIDEFSGDNKDIDLLTAKPNIYFDPRDYYLGYVCEAIQQARQYNKPVKLSGLWHTLIVSPSNNLIYVDTTDAKLRSFSLAALDQSHKQRANIEVTDFYFSKFDSIKLHDTFSEDAKQLSRNVQDIESFLWKLSLWTARGRIPINSDLQQLVQFNSWPNFTRQILTPYAIRITAYWQAKPSNLLTTIEDLGIEQRYVFSLFTAMLMLNHLELSASNVQQKPTNSSKLDSGQRSRTRQLLGQLIMKLKFNK